jgi:prepilin-type N-terminal cleavage/methylation domain-containing protein
MNRSTRRTSQRGFTLIETALATVIVGVGVLAMVSAQQAFHKQNYWSTHASIAERLANEIREATFILPRHDPVTGFDETTGVGWGTETNELFVGDFDDVDDFDGDGSGLVFSADHDNVTPDSGPINALREVISNMNGWSQIVSVRNVDPFDISGAAVADGTSTMLLVEVVVTYQGPGAATPTEMTRVSWISPN